MSMGATGEALEPIERERARQRQALAGPSEGRGAKPTGSEKFSEPVKGRAMDRVAAAVGMSRPTYTRDRQRQALAGENYGRGQEKIASENFSEAISGRAINRVALL